MQGENEDDEDDYDVLPKNMSKAATPAPSTPKDLQSPPRGGGARMSYTGHARPPSAGGTHMRVSRAGALASMTPTNYSCFVVYTVL